MVARTISTTTSRKDTLGTEKETERGRGREQSTDAEEGYANQSKPEKRKRGKERESGDE